MKSRKAKVQQGIRDLKGYRRSTYYPIIRLRGKWIEQAGISAGDTVQIKVTENQIIISR